MLKRVGIVVDSEAGDSVSEEGEGDRLWTVAATGDALIRHRILQHDNANDPGFSKLVELIHKAHVASVNLETSVFRLAEFQGWPAAERGGSYLVAEPFVVDELAGMGFSLFARANNHAGDWGIEGLLATTRELDRRDVAHAGVGEHLASASAPVFLDLAQGRVAMVSLTTTFPVSSKAAQQRRDVMGRPGCNGVAVRRRLRLPEELVEVLDKAAIDLGNQRLFEERGLGLEVGPDAEVSEWLEPADVERVLGQIEKAAALADLVLVNGHSHEPSNPVTDVPTWLPELAKACIDAGAHAYIGHGPHRLRGIEIYRDRPILYSLGNFIVHRDAQDPVPAEQYALFGLDPDTADAHHYLSARDGTSNVLSMTGDAYHESVVAMLSFSGGRLTGLELYPIELSATARPGTRGTPRLAAEPLGSAILAGLAELSAPRGVDIDIVDGIGHWNAIQKR